MFLQHGDIHALEREYLVMCAKCHEQENVSTYTKKQAMVKYRNLGWRKRMDGWTCPYCIERERLDRIRRASE